MPRSPAMRRPRAAPQTVQTDIFFWSFAILVILSLLIGGGGLKYGVANFLIQSVALVMLGYFWRPIASGWREWPALLKILIPVTLAVPVLQAIPVPASVWTNFPGRELLEQSLVLISDPLPAYSISLNSRASLTSASGLIVPIVVFALLATGKVTPVTGAKILAAFALFFVALGLVQVLAGPGTLRYAENSTSPVLHGTFANRNSGGLFLVLAMLVLIGLTGAADPVVQRFRAILWGIFALLAFGVILSQSRSSTALLVIPMGWAFVIGLSWLRDERNRRRLGKRRLYAVVGACVLAIATVVAVSQQGRVAETFSRFNDLETSREGIWEDTLAASDRYWPLGSGLGTFRDVFEVDESLEYLDDTNAGRAHNDYLETMLEAGLVGVVLIALWWLTIAVLALRAFKGGYGRLAAAGALGLLCIALQSVVDYPLRNQAMLVVAACLLGFVSFRSTKNEGHNLA